MSSPMFSRTIEPDSYLPLRLQVYEALREAIVSGRLRPGERIVEDRVCGELGVSRSPLREALRRLEGEGLVSIEPRRGAVVTHPSQQELMDLFDVREALEGLAASLAARRVTAEELAQLEEILRSMEEGIRSRDRAAVVQANTLFHELITRASRNRWLRGFVTSIRAQTRSVYRASIEALERAPLSLAEHRLLVEALRQRDSERAGTLARQHVLRAREAAVAAGLASRQE